jgi:Family of unknown function (DUF5754)
MKFISFHISNNGKKKYSVVLEHDGREKTISFGAAGMSDYTQHHDPERRARYLARHRAREDWTNPLTAGFWSRHVLWGDTTSLRHNLRETIRRFHLQ